MNEQLKQRLVGAVVLISLAVIFIPMLLDSERTVEQSWISTVPPRPEMRFEPLEIPLRPPLAPEPAPVAVAVIDEPSPGHVPDPTEQPKPAAEPAPSERRAENEPGPHAWVVQVGSFSNSANALVLRGQLRQKGFAAFVEEVKGDPAVYRVKVGPEVQREAAEKLRSELLAKFKLSAIVIHHP